MAIVTVTGPIPASQAGCTLSHEHLLCDLWAFSRSYDGILDDESLAVRELVQYRDSGGLSLVDATSGGLGRNPRALRRISKAAGVKVIMGSGWYRECVYPAVVHERDANALADLIVDDLLKGAEGTDVRAGIIGEIGTERKHITPAQERVFRAAARAQRRTGACIMTHTTHFGELAIPRHPQVVVLVSHRLDQQTVNRLAGHDRRAGIAPLQYGGARIKPQPGPLFLRTVTLLATLNQHRPHVGLEESYILDRWLVSGRRTSCDQHQAQGDADMLHDTDSAGNGCYTMISSIGLPWSMSRRLRPGISSFRESRPSCFRIVAWMSVT